MEDLTAPIAPASPPEAPAAQHVGGPVSSRRQRTARRQARLERRRRLVATVVLVLLGTAHTVVVWPGRMSNDTLTQIGLVRTGTYDDWHAALLIILWRPFWLLGVGPGLVTWLSTVLFVAGFYAVLRSAWSRTVSIGLTIVAAAFPPVLGHIGYLGRDQWYTALSLVAVGATMKLARAPSTAWRRVWLIAALSAVWLMVAARQNGLPVAGVALLAIVSAAGPWALLGRFDASRPSTGRTLRARCVRVGVAFAALLVLLGSQTVMKAAFGVRSSHPEQATYLYDLAALSVRERRVLLSPGVFPAQDLAVLDQRFSPTVVNTLLFGEDPPILFPVPDTEADRLRDDWLRAVTDHPRGYLVVRWQLWRTQMAWTGDTEWIYHPFVDPNPWGYRIENPTLDEPLQDYLKASARDVYLRGGPLYEVWVYLALTAFGMAYLLHRSPVRRVLGWWCVGSLVYQATIFVGAMGVGYRLAYPSVVLAVALVLVVMRDAAHLWARTEAAPPAVAASGRGNGQLVTASVRAPDDDPPL